MIVILLKNNFVIQKTARMAGVTHHWFGEHSVDFIDKNSCPTNIRI